MPVTTQGGTSLFGRAACFVRRAFSKDAERLGVGAARTGDPSQDVGPPETWFSGDVVPGEHFGATYVTVRPKTRGVVPCGGSPAADSAESAG